MQWYKSHKNSETEEKKSTEQVAAAKIPVHWFLVISFYYIDDDDLPIR